MSYTTLAFFVALAPVTLIAWALPTRAKAPWLLLASYAFYATWSVRYLLLLLAVTAVVYGGARAIGRTEDERRRRAVLIAALGAILATLFVFKYPELLAALLRPTGVRGVSGWLARVAAPLGISYYLFKAMSYLLDVHWETLEPERDPIAVALYLAFFPQILSGPIQRAPQFFAQLGAPDFGRADAERVERAVGLLVLGSFEKLVLADRIGPLVGALDALDALPGAARSMALAADYGYALQLFTDFSGLTHLALGIGLLFGVEGPPNFDRPFAAANIQEYWRRWHMSLTGWLTDYLFLPLRMALRRFGTRGLVVSLMLNMILIGAWHGSNATFLVFGVVHGAFLVGSSLTLAARNRFFKGRGLAERARRVAGPIVTFHMVVLALVFFRSPSVRAALDNLHAIVGARGDASPGWPQIARDVWLPALVASLFGLELATGWLGARRLAERLLTPARPALRWSVYSVAALLTTLLATATGGQFMYAKF